MDVIFFYCNLRIVYTSFFTTHRTVPRSYLLLMYSRDQTLLAPDGPDEIAGGNRSVAGSTLV